MLLLAAAALVAATPNLSAGQSDKCPRTTPHYALQPGQRITPKKLGELPPANAYYTVYRTIGGCEVPIVVKYGVGGR